MSTQRPVEVLDCKDAVRERDGYRCAECGIPNDVYQMLTGRSLDVHRLEPGSKYAEDQCITLCRECHLAKPKRTRKPPSAVRLVVSKETYWHLKQIASVMGYPGKPNVTEILAQVVAAEAKKLLTLWSLGRKASEERQEAYRRLRKPRGLHQRED